MSGPAVTVCPECGRTWECNPAGDCWCMALPVRLPLPQPGEDARCLCPCRLAALAERKDPP